ncbi:hypothetical protein HT094_02295 [Shewanella sp. ZOR0012]|nr:hypothetical protein [Shewanella sp. ZOR0012]
MDYQETFLNAIDKTLELGLNLDSYPKEFSEPCPEHVRASILKLTADVLNGNGFRCSSELANKCVPVHLIIQYWLKQELNISSHITIGERYWSDDEIYCKMSYDYIKSEMIAPNHSKPINAHVWLTLPDGSILDCTAEAFLDVTEDRGDYPVNQCLMFVRPSETPPSGYHRPYLVGTDFLEKAGVIKLG